MKFKTLLVSKEHWFAIGIEEESGRHYISIPMCNRLVDYGEYYEISNEDFEMYYRDLSLALGFVEACKAQENDHLLFLQPGSDRGVPRG